MEAKQITQEQLNWEPESVKERGLSVNVDAFTKEKLDDKMIDLLGQQEIIPFIDLGPTRMKTSLAFDQIN